METKETEFIYSDRIGKQQRFDKRLIAYVVQLAEQGVPRRDLIQEYGMASCTLKDWIDRYGSSIVKHKSYTLAEKRSVFRAVEAGMSVRQAQIAFDISYPSVIRGWIKKFREENVEISDIKSLEVVKKTTNQSDNTELKALQEALAEANLKIKALDTMIDIAEEQLKIDIRKKSGARQSSK
ncbi:helix-turn-helix domain-containing protein [Pedobacter sp. PAMC26386]|nr:helix-turn-helix domain-containing protein [Pedobacter sp. PAMC26386]QNK62446.1 helix-turn-helix domain-containing protein [Pedobacter sp. PAMC26386]QNK62558.1 helix-turn-helix domain-containing protein [Pedobacter sp. PAMC26386]QNK62675.1 helix-turn-helix domain-containing protein [Pedobacter sp. PAMC26386]QNK63350.1 helix-turn-helix domain-containing protein [Pedobacter sp. PAMC26386]